LARQGSVWQGSRALISKFKGHGTAWPGEAGPGTARHGSRALISKFKN